VRAHAPAEPAGRRLDRVDGPLDRVLDQGERAAAAIRGLGRRGEPSAAYRDVFPAYDAVAEEAIQDEQVPAARRAVVRRYFEAIRPEE